MLVMHIGHKLVSIQGAMQLKNNYIFVCKTFKLCFSHRNHGRGRAQRSKRWGEEQEASRRRDVPGHMVPVLLPKRDLANAGKFVDISTCTFHK